MKSSIREQKISEIGVMSPEQGGLTGLDAHKPHLAAREVKHKPLRGRGGTKIGRMLSLAILYIFSTDACQFDNNVLKSSLSQRSTPSFFVAAQFGGGRFGGRNFGGGGGGRRPQGKKEEGEDYYKLLGVPRDANDATIKKKFKKLAMKYHPDKNKDDPEGAKQKF